MIRELFDFKWLKPIKMDLAKRDRSRKCAYHKEHGHNTEQYKSLHYLVEKLVRAGHLKQYIRLERRHGDGARSSANTTPTTLVAPKAIINYIHG